METDQRRVTSEVCGMISGLELNGSLSLMSITILIDKYINYISSGNNMPTQNPLCNHGNNIY